MLASSLVIEPNHGGGHTPENVLVCGVEIVVAGQAGCCRRPTSRPPLTMYAMLILMHHVIDSLMHREVGMARTTVNIDDVLLSDAQRVLGTKGVTDTINAAMSAVVRRAALDEFTINDFDITDADLADSRRDRATA
jgi:Arc/MetJ family transcription regulator